jgi:hypothetical protein
MTGARIGRWPRTFGLLVLLAACGDDGEGGAVPTATPTPTATHTPTATATATLGPPNPFGFRDDLLRVGAARASIAPVPAGTAGAAPAGEPVFETFTDFDFTLTCPENPELQLHFVPNALFDGVLTVPAGAEPWIDCGGRTGRFDAGVDMFRDLDGNGRFDGDDRNPEGLEPFDDANGNGLFDAIWLGGFDSARAADGVDAAAPPVVTALVVSQAQEFVVLVTLDTIGNVSTHLTPLRQRIATALGLDGTRGDSPDVGRIIVSSLHNHEAADTIGVAGPTALAAETVREFVLSGFLPDLGPFAGVPVRTGINFAYREWMDDRAVAAVQEAVAQLRPALLRVAAAPAPMESDAEALNPDAADQTESFRIPRDQQMLMTDIRWPFVRDPLVLAVQAQDAVTHGTIATVVNWTNHVEVLGSRNRLLSADYAGHLRAHLEARLGGVGIFVVGTVGGLQTPLQDVLVPVLDAAGGVVTRGGATVPFRDFYAPVLDGTRTASAAAAELSAAARRAVNDSPEKAASLGRLVAEVAALGVERAPTLAPPALRVTAAPVLIPLENPTLYLAAVLGVVEGRSALYLGEPSPALVTDRPERCGLVGCLRETITLADFGDFQWITAPGELLPEYTLGRPRPGIAQDAGIRFVTKEASGAVVHDFGVNAFAPIAGLRALREGPLFVFGLAQGQLGYFIPQSDFVNVFEGSLPRPEDLTEDLGVLADLDIAPLLELERNPEFPSDEELTIRDIVDTAWAKFPPARYPMTSLGGVSLVDLPDVNLAAEHPNVIGNNNSLGPRAGHVVYNALCDLTDDGAANASCPTALPVADDPNQ